MYPRWRVGGEREGDGREGALLLLSIDLKKRGRIIFAHPFLGKIHSWKKRSFIDLAKNGEIGKKLRLLQTFVAPSFLINDENRKTRYFFVVH